MRGLSDEEQSALVRSVGTHRVQRHLSPLEVSQHLKKAIDGGSTRKECAADLQLGTTQVSEFLRLMNLTPEIQYLADWGRLTESTISFSSLALLVSLLPKDQIRAAEAILAHRLSWREVVQLVQIANRSRKAVGECIDAVVKLRPEIETRHLFIGSITSERLKMSLADLVQHGRDKLMEKALRKVLSPSVDVSGRLGVKNFTIVGSKNPAQILNMNADAFERAINDMLLEVSGRR